MPAVKLTREVAEKRLPVYGFFNTFFRAIVPAIIAVSVFGAFKNEITALPDWLTFIPESWTPSILAAYQRVSNLSFGVFAAAVIIGMESRDAFKKTAEELKLQQKVVYAKTRAIGYIIAGVAILVIYLFATKAMIFFFGSGVSSLVAIIFENKRNECKTAMLGGVTNA